MKAVDWYILCFLMRQFFTLFAVWENPHKNSECEVFIYLFIYSWLVVLVINEVMIWDAFHNEICSIFLPSF